MYKFFQDLQYVFNSFSELMLFSDPNLCQSYWICQFKNFLVISNWFILSMTIYFTILIVLGFSRKEEIIKNIKPTKRFLILIPAHNEENVIKNTVSNFIKTIDYPKSLFDLYVIADNCSDNTAKLAKENGAKVIIHNSKKNEPKGKPFAIRYALEILGKKIYKDYDVIVFIDADNIVKTNFLNVFNYKFSNNVKVLQSYLDSKNPNQNFITTAYSAAYFQTNRFFEHSKSKIGLSASLGGTGFGIDSKLLYETEWNYTTITEDLEFQMDCLIKDIVPKYTKLTRVYDEKPSKVKQSLIQRTRWSRGHWSVLFKKGFLLFKALFKNKNKKAILDGIFYLLSPLRSVLILFLFPAVIYYTSKSSDFSVISLTIFVFFVVLLPSYLIWYAIKYDVEQEIKPGLVYVYFSLVFYSTTFLFIHFWGFLTNRKNIWIRTEHMSQNNTKQLEKDYKKKKGVRNEKI